MRLRAREGDVPRGQRGQWRWPARAAHALLGASGLALVALAQPLVAATITVNRFDSHSGADTLCSLRDAITSANDDEAPWGDCTPGSGADTIVLTGDVTLTVVDDDTPSGDVSGLPAVSTEIAIEGNGYKIERHPAAPLFGLLVVTGNLELRNVTLSGGEADWAGGAVMNRGRLTLIGSTVSGNKGIYAGGIGNVGWLVLIDSTVSGNEALLGGGGIGDEGIVLVLRNSTVSGNSADDGGGIWMAAGQVTLIGSTLSSNDATLGGGIWADGGSVTLIRSMVSDNSSSGGGGVYLGPADGPGQGATLTALESTVSGNLVHLFAGGAILNVGSGAVRLLDSTLSDNHAQSGGAIFSEKGETVLNRSAVLANTAPGGGAGIENNAGTVSVTNSTLSGNQASSFTGGAINNQSGVVTLTHSTLMGNLASGGGAGVHNQTGTVTVTSSIIASSTGSNCSGAIIDGLSNFDDDGSCPGPGVISFIDPNLDDNGGPTLTHALRPGSTALNTTFPCLLVTDQRGGWRDFLCDSGAFELGIDDSYEYSGVGASDDTCPGHQIQYGHAEHHMLLDEDWVWFDVQVGATYEIETANLHGAPVADTLLELGRSCTTPFASDDNGGAGNASKITYTATGEDVATGGRLHVRVQEVVAYDNDIGYDLTVTCVADCPPCAASGFNIFSLFDETIFTFRLVEACEKIWAGRTSVIPGATLMLRSGETVQFEDGFVIWRGGELVVEVDPSLKATP